MQQRALVEIVLWSSGQACVWMRFTAGRELAGQGFGLDASGST